jgi:hypothetical protein
MPSDAYHYKNENSHKSAGVASVSSVLRFRQWLGQRSRIKNITAEHAEIAELRKTKEGVPDQDCGADISRCEAFSAVSASSAVIFGFATA